MNKDTAKSYTALTSSMLIFGTLGIFRRYIPLSSAMLALFRGLLGSAFLLILVFVKGGKLQKLKSRTVFLLAVTGALMGFNWMLLFEAYNYTSVAVATMCYYMQPTIVILLSPFVFHEKLTFKKLICAVAAIIGMVFVSGILNGNGIKTRDIKGILFGLGAAALYSAVVILNKKVVVKDVYEKSIIQLAAVAIILIPYLLLTEDITKTSLNGTAVCMVLLVGIVHTGIAYALYFGSMKNLKAQSIAVMSYIDPVFALLLSAVILHEGLTVYGAIGAILIIGSAFVSEIARN